MAVDRRQLAREQPAKSARWPRTERRQARLAGVLARRQPDLTVVIEDVHDRHNISAVLRSCDAVGILDVHTIYTDAEPPAGAFARTTSASAAKWIGVHRHVSVADCFEALRERGFAILATSIDDTSRDLYDCDLVRPTAFVFGNEHRGVSDEARRGADSSVAIPMMGMVESLNISVACAVSLYEAFRQRRAAGSYQAPKLDDAARAALLDDWLRR